MEEGAGEPVQLTCVPEPLLGYSIDLMSRSILFSETGDIGLLYHRTIPDFGQRRGFVRMADGELL